MIYFHVFTEERVIHSTETALVITNDFLLATGSLLYLLDSSRFSQ